MSVFKFDKDEVARHIRYELNLFQKVKAPLNYIIKTLEELGNSITIKSLDKKIDLSKLKEKEGKNYHWSVIKYNNVTLVLRRYQQHFTIFSKVEKEGKYPKVERGAFEFFSDLDKLPSKEHDKVMDAMWEKPFLDLNKCIKDLFILLGEKEGGVHSVWNPYSWKVPKHVEVKLAFANEQIHSFDKTIFCFEEIDSIHLELFAETTMLKKLEEFKTKIGEDFDEEHTIKEVRTEVEDDYYHGVGLVLAKKNKPKETDFEDVYSLTRWHYKSIFKDEKEEEVRYDD